MLWATKTKTVDEIGDCPAVTLKKNAPQNKTDCNVDKTKTISELKEMPKYLKF